MSTNIKVIRFTSILSLILSILTYAISLNIAYDWCEWKWLSNDFLLTFFGGAFASMAVVLICEIQKYLQNKKECCEQLFLHTSYIYAQLFSLNYTLSELIANPDARIYTTNINRYLETTKYEIGIIDRIDLSVFLKKSQLNIQHSMYHKWLHKVLAMFLNECVYIDMAVNTDKINNLKQFKTEGVITSSSPTTGSVLKKLQPKFSSLLVFVNKYLEFLDNYSENKYNWKQKKENIECSVHIKIGSINDYLKSDLK